MKIITVRDIDSIVESVRPEADKEVKNRILAIISDVRRRKDKALKEYEKRFNKIALRSFRVSASEIKSAYSKVSEVQVKAIELAKGRLEKSEIAVRNELQNISIDRKSVVVGKEYKYHK